MTDGELCLLCKANNKRSFLHSYQINLEEAIVLCENPQCSYPVGSTNYCGTFRRSFSEVEPPVPKDVCSLVPEAQVALQARMAEYSRNNAKLQRTVIGTQTDKRPLSRSSKTVGSRLIFKSRNFVPTNVNMTGPQANEKRNGNFEKLNNHTNQFKKVNEFLYGKFVRKGPSDSGKSQGAHNGTGNISPVDVNGMKGFTGFTFNGREKIRKQTSKSEPSLDKLQNDMFLSSNPNSKQLQVASFHQGIQGKESNSKLVNTGDNAIDKTAVVDTSTSIDSKTDRLSATQKKWCLEQARSFFSYPSRFVQWRNKEALCWLDAVQCLIVHNRHIHKTVFDERFDRESVLFKLVNTHKQAQDLLVDLVNCENYDQHLPWSSSQDPEILSKSSSHKQLTNGIPIVSPRKVEMKLVSIDGSVDVKTGAGDVGSSKTQNDCHTGGNVSELSDLQKATHIDELLNIAREDVWHKLQPKLKFERRRNDSPVFTMSSLLREHPDVEKLFKMRYSFRLQCHHCGHCEEECFEKVLPTFPNVIKDFSITKPAHSRTCSHCGCKDARRTMEYQRLSDSMVMHFTEGLPYKNWKRLEFEHQGSIYTITGMVQYINNPDHFIAWLRNPTDGHWMKCDDLKSQVCVFQSDTDIQPNQIHMVMWEKVPLQSDNCLSPCFSDAILPASDKSKCHNTIKHDIANASILNSNLQTAEYTALRALQNGQNKVPGKTGLFDGFVQNNISHCVLVSGDSANYSRVSEIPTGRCVIPKEAGSSTLSSACSDLSEDLLQFASAPPELFVVKPVPRLLPEDSKSELGRVSCDDRLFVSVKSAENGVVRSINQAKPGITEAESNKLGEMTNDHGISYNNSSKLSGQKPEIKPSSVFCPPCKLAPNVLCAKPSIGIKAQNVYPPFCVQKSGNTNVPIHSKLESCDKSVGSTLVCDTDVESNSQRIVNVSLEKENTQHPSANVRSVLSKPQEHPAVSGNSSGKGDKFRFPSVNRCDKSLITYLKSKKASTSAMARDNFMMMNDNQQKTKVQPDLHSDQAVMSSSFSQLSSDGNVSYLGKVQQYLLNKVNPCESKFDGLMLKSSKPDAAHMEVLPGQGMSNKTMDSNLSCRLISPMSEWFGRKADSPPKSAYSSNTDARKRKSKSSDERFGHVKKTCIEKSFANGGTNSIIHGGRQQTNNNGTASKQNGEHLIDQKPLCIKGGSRNIAGEGYLSLGENPRKSPENSDCVLQDLYEALNIPFEDIGNTMANIMSDVDDILDLVKPTEMIPAAGNNVLRSSTKGLT